MAFTLFFVILLFGSATSLPLSQKVKSVKSAKDVERFVSTIFGLKSVLNGDENIVKVKSYGVSFEVRRTKRDAIRGNHSCPDGMKWLLFRCVKIENYDESKEDELSENTFVIDPGGLSSRDDTEPRNNTTFDVDDKEAKNETVKFTTSCPEGTNYDESKKEELSENTVVIDPGGLSSRDDTEQRNSTTFDVDDNNMEPKNETVNNSSCPEGMKLFEQRCVTLEMSKQSSEDKEDRTSTQPNNRAALSLQSFHYIPMVLLAIVFP